MEKDYLALCAVIWMAIGVIFGMYKWIYKIAKTIRLADLWDCVSLVFQGFYYVGGGGLLGVFIGLIFPFAFPFVVIGIIVYLIKKKITKQ